MFKKALLTAMFMLSPIFAQNVIKIGIEGAYPPFSYVNPDRTLGGFEVDLAHLFCAKMNKPCEIIQVDFDALIPSLNTKKIDAILASMSITDARKEVINFSNKYYKTPAKFVIAKGAQGSVDEAGLKGKSIGVQSGTIHETYANDVFKKTSDVRSYRNLDEAIFDLDAGRIDFVFADIAAVDVGYLQKGYDKTLEFIGPEFNDPKWFGEGIGVGIRKDEPELLKLFNDAIKQSREDESYQKIAEKYFTIDVFGEE